MSDHSHEHHHSITPVGVYLGVFFGLMFFTALTVFSATRDLGWLNTPIALAIAGCKASIVVWFFMEIRHATSLTRMAVLAAIFWLTLLFIFTFSDFKSRNWEDHSGAWGHTLPIQDKQ